MVLKRPTPQTTISFDQDSDSIYTVLGCIETAVTPGQSKDAIDAMCLDSQTDETEPSKITNVKDFAFTLFTDFDDATHGLLEATFAAGTKIPWRITQNFTPQAYQTDFIGWIMDLGDIEHTPKGIEKREVVVKVVSIPVRTTV